MGGWTTSFWTGQCWLAADVTGDDRFRDAADTQLETFARRLEDGDTDTHDLGFLYTLSAVAGYRLTGQSDYRELALEAAQVLVERYRDGPGIIQAWGPLEESQDGWVQGRMIADTMMNLPLLYWASETTGEHRFAAIADTHARTNAQHIVRSDASTAHTVVCDLESGDPLAIETHQAMPTTPVGHAGRRGRSTATRSPRPTPANQRMSTSRRNWRTLTSSASSQITSPAGTSTHRQLPSETLRPPLSRPAGSTNSQACCQQPTNARPSTGRRHWRCSSHLPRTIAHRPTRTAS